LKLIPLEYFVLYFVTFVVKFLFFNTKDPKECTKYSKNIVYSMLLSCRDEQNEFYQSPR
jgi:hypothetical protein